MPYPQIFAYNAVTNGWDLCDILGIGQNGKVIPLEMLDAYVDTTPVGAPEMSTLFDDGTFGFFDIHSGCVLSASYAYSGANGCRMTPDPSTGIASLTSNNSFPGGQPWVSFSFRFRLVTQPLSSDTYMNLFEIGNALTVAPKSQFTVYFNSGHFYCDFAATEKLDMGAAPTDGLWHRFEARVYFGDTTYSAYARVDDGTITNLVSGTGKTPTTAEVLWIHYPGTAVDYTMDIDSILLTTAANDPGWLTE